jgi:beta-lactamase class A
MVLRRYAFAVLAFAVITFIAVTPAEAQPRVATIREALPGAVSVLPGSAAALEANLLAAAAGRLVSQSTLNLTASVDQLVNESGGSAGATLIEIGGSSPVVWSFNGVTVFTAASTYKLAALMMEAQGIAAGTTDPNGIVCYEESDYEAGWFDDYTDGSCFTRTVLAQRAGLYSDNTAGHILVRDLGGADALNAWAASAGAAQSVFFTDNTTSSNDLAALWADEVEDKLGGARAQSWLYPVLTGTTTESGIPAGAHAGAVVVHKTGEIDDVVDDAALVENGPRGDYVLTVMTSGLGGDAGWQLIASVSATVWTFESTRKS